MSDPASLLQAANYAFRTEGKKNKAESLATEVLRKFPESSEANYAKKLLAEIEGKLQSEPVLEQTPATPAKVEVINRRQEVVLVDIDVPFFPLVGIMVKWIIAAIPAMIIATIILFVIGTIFAGMVGIPLGARL